MLYISHFHDFKYKIKLISDYSFTNITKKEVFILLAQIINMYHIADHLYYFVKCLEEVPVRAELDDCGGRTYLNTIHNVWALTNHIKKM